MAGPGAAAAAEVEPVSRPFSGGGRRGRPGPALRRHWSSSAPAAAGRGSTRRPAGRALQQSTRSLPFGGPAVRAPGAHG